MGFLQKFGYLEGRQDSNSEALFREEAVVNAIKTMQSFGGLSPTGKMDNDTLQVNLCLPLFGFTLRGDGFAEVLLLVLLNYSCW